MLKYLRTAVNVDEAGLTAIVVSKMLILYFFFIFG